MNFAKASFLLLGVSGPLGSLSSCYTEEGPYINHDLVKKSEAGHALCSSLYLGSSYASDSGVESRMRGQWWELRRKVREE